MQEKLIIECDENGIRLDKYLSLAISDLSRTQIQELISAGGVRFNGDEINNPSAKTKFGSYEVDLSLAKIKPSHLAPYDFPLNIIYEDDYLMVLNKPAGLTVHPGAGNYDKTLANALVAYAKENLSKLGGEFRPGIVHRLDKDTSGLMIIAKDDQTHQILSENLSEREIKRLYLALVYGSPELKAGTIKTFVAKDFHDHTKMVITKGTGKEAITHYVVYEEIAENKFSLIECKLDTGRTHQIRIHLNYKGFPVVGDPVYNSSKAKYLSRMDEETKKIVSSFPRQALHAYRLEFTHPITEEIMEFEIDLPEDMKELCQKLEDF